MNPADGRSSVLPNRLSLARCIGRPRSVAVVEGDVDEVLAIVGARNARVARVAREGEVDAAVRAQGPVDLLFVGDALEHVGDPAEAMKRWSSLLGDGGHVLVTMPLSQLDRERTGPFTSDNAIKILEMAGLEVMRVEDWAASPVYVRLVKSVMSLATKTPRSSVGRAVVVARRPPQPGKLKLTVGMLTLNEEESIEEMIGEVRKLVPDANILVIDSSSDRTPLLAARLGARVVRQLPPRGHGPAMEALMYEAAQDSDALVYLDCDFTYPSAAITRIRELLEGGADVVNASRTHRYPKEMPVPNFIANRLFAATAQVVHGVPTTDVHSGMRGYRCSVIRAFDFSGEGDALPLDTLILPAKSHYHVVELPIPYFRRVGASKLARLRGTVWTFVRIATAIGEGSRVRRGVRYRHVDE